MDRRISYRLETSIDNSEALKYYKCLVGSFQTMHLERNLSGSKKERKKERNTEKNRNVSSRVAASKIGITRLNSYCTQARRDFWNGQMSFLCCKTRPTLSQFKSFKTRRTALLNYIKFANLLILRVYTRRDLSQYWSFGNSSIHGFRVFITGDDNLGS